jgi:ketosteroid isomerase-like protein
MPPDVPCRVGRAQIRREMQPQFDHFNMSGMTIQVEEVCILGDRAYSHGAYTFEMTPKDGGATGRYCGKFLDILEKQVDGSWKIAVDCFNYNEPSVEEV